MSSKRSLFAIVHRAPIARIGYPLGVFLVFLIIFFSAFFSYRFFFAMIGRATAPQSFEVSEGVTFHLDAYHAIAKAFTTSAPPPSVVLVKQKRESVVVFHNAQLRNDRVILLESLLKSNGWQVKVSDEKEEQSARITTISAKEGRNKEMEAITLLLINNGFIIVTGKPVAKNEKFDIVITLGAY